MTELLFLLANAAFAQVPQPPANASPKPDSPPIQAPARPRQTPVPAPVINDSGRKLMEASLDKQRASIRKQTQSAVPQASSADWFTNPWPVESVEPLGAPPLSPVQPVAQCDPMPLDQVKPLISSAAAREGIKEDLLTAVMQRESAYKPCAVSPKGAQGLMQLMPATAKELGVKDPFDPQENVSAGARLLKQLLEKYKGDVKLALGAYNAGQGAVDREGGVPPFPETKDYITNILSKLIY